MYAQDLPGNVHTGVLFQRLKFLKWKESDRMTVNLGAVLGEAGQTVFAQRFCVC